MELVKNMLFDGRYRLLSMIGHGASAQVWKACDTYANNLIVALKIFSDNGGMNTYGWQNFEHEFTSVYNLIHTNLLPPTGYNKSKEGGVPYLILQYCDNGSSSSMVGRIDEDTLLHFLHDVSAGLAYLHERNIIHRDIKPDNILLDEQCNFLVTDFGISSVGFSDTTTSGSRAYMSPERFPDPGQPTDETIAIKASDIWSLGATAYELMTGDVPFGEMGGAFQKAGEEMKPLPDSFSPEVRELVESCLNINPWDRPKARDIQQKIEGFWNNGNWKGKAHNPRRKIYITAACVAAALALFFIVDFNRTKVRYYRDYVEQWGIPQGVGRVNAIQMKHMSRLYRFEYKHGKLQRMSHINSYGSLINDGESERIDRPVDMRLEYTSKGRLTKVKVYGRGGKTEYAKCYNEKLTNVTFRYDDEFETEKRLGSKTIGYVHAMLDDEPRGQISHYLLTYDKNGYVDTLRYANSNNHNCCDQDGIYARAYLRDKKGRVIEEHYLGYDNTPKATQWGLGKKLFKYEDDNLVQVTYQTVDGNPALDAKDGVYVYEMEYDKRNNLVKMIHRDNNGNLMLPVMMGYSTASITVDKRGNQTRIEYSGTDEKPITKTDGTSSTVFRYDERGYVNYAAYEDVDGNPCVNTNGFALITFVNDDKGNPLETWYHNADSSLTFSSYGYAGYKCRYDSVGNITELMNYGTDGLPVKTSNGIFGWSMKYNSRGLRSELTFLGADMKPMMSDENISIVSYFYDEHANETGRVFRDSTGRHLTESNENIAGWNSKYDEFGNETERTFFNKDSIKTLSISGYASQQWEYDSHGNMLKNRFFDTDNRLVMVNGCAGNNNVYDEKGNLLENKPVGTDEKLAPNKLISRYQYDKNDNIIEFAVFHNNGDGATNSIHFHKYIKKYDSRSNPVEECYYNIHGKLTHYSDDKYAIVRKKYDERGNIVELRYFDANEKPVCCNEGWAMSRYKYDAMGNILQHCYFDVNDKPTDVNKMVPEGICRYDAQGRRTYIAACDGNGNLITNPATGWCIQEIKYDRRGNVLEKNHYDKYHNLVLVKSGNYCTLKYEYDDRGNQTELQLHNLNGCFERQQSRYNDCGKLVEFRYCHSNGSLKMSASGYAKYRIDYQKNGIIPTMVIYYDTSGRKLAYQIYNAKTQRWGDYKFDI